MLEYILPYISGNGSEMTKDAVKPFPENTPPAMAYVPFQQWEEPYAPNSALAAGTIFPSLDLPFMGREVRS